MCLSCLLVLVLSGNLFELRLAPEPGTDLMETERNAIIDAQYMVIKPPTVVADPCIWHGFASAARDASDLQPVLLPIGLYIDLFQHSIGSWMRICYMINS